MADFWIGKTPCWELLGCTERLYSQCAAYQNRERPCWEIAGTECRRVLSFDWDCRDCKVFKLSGGDRQPSAS